MLFVPYYCLVVQYVHFMWVYIYKCCYMVCHISYVFDLGEERMVLMSRPMSDFVGLEDVDPSIAQALINFSFFVASGDMDRSVSNLFESSTHIYLTLRWCK